MQSASAPPSALPVGRACLRATSKFAVGAATAGRWQRWWSVPIVGGRCNLHRRGCSPGGDRCCWLSFLGYFISGERPISPAGPNASWNGWPPWPACWEHNFRPIFRSQPVRSTQTRSSGSACSQPPLMHRFLLPLLRSRARAHRWRCPLLTQSCSCPPRCQLQNRQPRRSPRPRCRLQNRQPRQSPRPRCQLQNRQPRRSPRPRCRLQNRQPRLPRHLLHRSQKRWLPAPRRPGRCSWPAQRQRICRKQTCFSFLPRPLCPPLCLPLRPRSAIAFVPGTRSLTWPWTTISLSKPSWLQTA